MTDIKTQSKKDGRNVLFALLAFFAVFCSVDAYFVYKAVKTHTGTVAENAYERGLAYNETLDKAERQRRLGITSEVFYKNGILYLTLNNKNKQMHNVVVKAHVTRAVQEKYDFNVSMKPHENDIFATELDLPLKGLWTAHIEATWQDSKQRQQRYQTALTFIAP